MTDLTNLTTAQRKAFQSYAESLHRALSGALIAHMPKDGARDVVSRASRVLAIGMLANILGTLIQGAPDDKQKGVRRRMRQMAIDVINQSDPAP